MKQELKKVLGVSNSAQTQKGEFGKIREKDGNLYIF